MRITLFWRIFAIFAAVSSICVVAAVVLVARHWVERDWRARSENRVEREVAEALAGDRRARLRYVEVVDADGAVVLRHGQPPRRHYLHQFQLAGPDGAQLYARTSYSPPPRLMREAVARLNRAQLLALLAGAVLASALVSRMIARPLSQLASASRAFAQAPDSAQVPPHLASRRDEIGDLAAGFAAAMARTRASLAAQRALTRDISHELRAPLARLQTLAGLLEQRGGPADLLEQVHSECDQLRGLIGEITALARADSAAELAREPVDLSALAGALVELWRTRAPERAITFTAPAHATLPRGDAALLGRGLGNLIANACRYSTAGGAIEVSLRATTPPGYELAVADSGPGLPPEELARVKQPFYRGQGAMHGEGFGLGLTIAARAAEAHGGQLALSINRAGGLTATLTLNAP